MIHTELSLVTVALCGFGLWIFGMFVVSLVRSLSWHRQDRVTQVLLPQIREALVDYLAGSDNQTRLREFVRTSRADVGAAIMSFEGTVAGSARDRLCELALDLALVHDWCHDAHAKNAAQRRTCFARLSFVCSYEPCRRVAGDLLLRALDDPDDEVKLSASRALVQSGGIEEVERVFEHAVSANLVVRILLTEELRRHAVPLCQRAIPKVLQSGDLTQVLAMLQMVTAWERALPMPGIGDLLEVEDRRVRVLALRLASLVPDAPEIRKGILEALGDPDPEIAGYGARAAGRLRLESALPGLARCLRIGNPDLARAAAEALAEMPARGWVTLQELSSSSNTVTARAASEALSRARGTA
jgi:HEAT repeat protein